MMSLGGRDSADVRTRTFCMAALILSRFPSGPRLVPGVVGPLPDLCTRDRGDGDRDDGDVGGYYRYGRRAGE